MRQFLKSFVLLGALSLTATAQAGQTADYEDIYLMGWGGWRSVTTSLQFGLGAGYVFTEGFGIGAQYEQSGNDPYGALELRWFLEPFESAIAFGVEKHDLGSNRSEMSPMFTLAGDYLFSLTPSLALRASVKWLLPIDAPSGVFTGIGFRVLL